MSPVRDDVDWVELLRQRHLRATAARVHVLSALEALEHATPEEIFAHAGSQSPGLNLSTVYRTLDVLGDRGLVGHTHLDHAAPTYMLSSHATHAHLVCRGCHEVLVLDATIASTLSSAVDRTHGFALDAGHISLFGLCADCQA